MQADIQGLLLASGARLGAGIDCFVACGCHAFGSQLRLTLAKTFLGAGSFSARYCEPEGRGNLSVNDVFGYGYLQRYFWRRLPVRKCRQLL